MADDHALVSSAMEIMSPIEDAALLSVLQVVLEDRPSVVQELADWMLPDKAYGNAKLLQDNRQTGRIKSFAESKGYGFIECAEVTAAFGADVFVHRSQIGCYAAPGTEVSFAILVNKDRKPQAFDLGPAQGGKDMKKGKGAPVGKGATGGKACGGKAPAAWGPAEKGGWDPWAPAAAWGADAAWGKGAPAAYADPWGGCQAWGKGDSWGKGQAAWSGKGPGAKGPGAKGPGAKGPGSKGPSTKPSVPFSDKGPPQSTQEIAGITDLRHYGTIKSFNEARGFGFITCDEMHEQFGADTFLHRVQFQGFEIGQQVSFDVFLNKDGKPQAKELAVEEFEPDAKRMKFI